MKKPLLTLVILLCFLNTFATNYYLSSSSGNDNNSGTSESSAWKTITKLNSILGNLQAGDVIFFKRGDTFSGALNLKNSGVSGNPITFNAFGSGNKPIITGRIRISNWTNKGNNIWTATNTGTGNVTNMFINAIPQNLSRYPKLSDTNNGYLTFTSHNGNSSITDPTLPNSPSFVGKQLVVRVNAWYFNRRTVQSQSGGTLTVSSNFNLTPKDNAGYFFQNDPSFCTTQGEWAYNSSSKLVTIYSSVDPNTLNIEVSGYDKIFNIDGVNYITLNNLQIDGSGTDSVYMNNSNTIDIQNCDFLYAGENAITMNNTKNSTFSYNTINKSNSSGILQKRYCDNFNMVGNTITNVALHPGRDRAGTNPAAARLYGSNQLIQYNKMDNLGYIGIFFRGEGVDVKNNEVSNYCSVYEDGGGIYTFNGDSDSPVSVPSYVRNNIVRNSSLKGHIGSPLSVPTAEGIYMDDGSRNVQILDNTVFDVAKSGIFLHNSDNITVKNNNVYNTGILLFLYHDSVYPQFPIINGVITNNTFVAKNDTQKMVEIVSKDAQVLTNNFNYNYYCRPYKEAGIMGVYISNDATSQAHISLSEWQSKYKLDTNSKGSPILLTTQNSDEYLRLEYNSTNADKVISVGTGYLKADGTNSPSSITLKPFTSTILFKDLNFVNHAPVAVNDAVTTQQNIEFTSTISLVANDTDEDGNSLNAIAGTFTTNQGGSLVLATDGNYTYTPKTNFSGSDSVSYTVSDGDLTDVGTLTFSVEVAQPVNHAPVAVNDAVTAQQDVVFNSSVSVIANDTDEDGDNLNAIAGTFTTNQGGTIEMARDGSYKYTTILNFVGVDSFQYSVSDGLVTSNATLTINIEANSSNNNNHSQSSLTNLDAKVYPTVVHDEFSIEITNSQLNKGTLYNNNGQFITSIELSKGVNTVNISHFMPGVYILQIIGSQNPITKRIIKA